MILCGIPNGYYLMHMRLFINVSKSNNQLYEEILWLFTFFCGIDL